jgi:hypothetical protein
MIVKDLNVGERSFKSIYTFLGYVFVSPPNVLMSTF